MVIMKRLVEGKTYFGASAIGLYCYFGNKVKYGLLSNTCFKKRNNMAVGKTFREINFYKKQCLPVTIWNEKNSSKKVLSITYILEKKLFTAATFKSF